MSDTISDHVLVSFIIPVRNDARRLDTCIASIKSQKNEGHISIEIIVGDNGSTDDSAQVARRHNVKTLNLPGLTVAQMRNRMANEATGTYLAFVDADHLLDKNWLNAALAAIIAPHTGVVGRPYSPPENASWVQLAYDRMRVHPTVLGPTRWLGSGNMLVRREVFMALAGFDETLVTCEDVDFCQRVAALGWKLMAVPGMKSVHMGDPATLKMVFLGELWRGRDNIKVTLRGPKTLRAYASMLIPSANLFFMVVIMITLLLFGAGGETVCLLILASALAASLLIFFMHAIKLSKNDFHLSVFIQNFLLAVAFDSSRALSLILRTGHGVRAKK